MIYQSKCYKTGFVLFTEHLWNKIQNVCDYTSSQNTNFVALLRFYTFNLGTKIELNHQN